MFYTPKDKGLPIGNLTSQFFANIYLNELDHFIRHHIKGVLFWQRYVDDLLLLSDDLVTLRTLPKVIDLFLKENLNIRLNPKKTIIQPIDRGIDHLGYWLKPNYTLVRRKNVITCRRKISYGKTRSSTEHFNAIINSYLGLFSHGDCYRLSQSVNKQAGR